MEQSEVVKATSPARGRHRYSILLVSQLALIVLSPILAGDQPHPGLFGVFAIAVLGASLHVVSESGRVSLLACSVGAVALVANLWAVLLQSRAPLIIQVASNVAFFAVVAAVILKDVLTSPRITAETIYGAICAYLFMGVGWGGGYALVNHLTTGAFQTTITTRALIWPDFIFFSFVTLTTLGYGDMIPLNAYARSLAMLEAVVGVMYPAVLLGRLIALYAPPKAPDSED